MIVVVVDDWVAELGGRNRFSPFELRHFHSDFALMLKLYQLANHLHR